MPGVLEIGGHEATLIAIAGDHATWVWGRSAPPGSRHEARVVDGCSAFRLKVHNCKAMGDGRFELEGRVMDAKKDVMPALRALLAP
jgi:hypothetical protein